MEVIEERVADGGRQIVGPMHYSCKFMALQVRGIGLIKVELHNLVICLILF